MPCSLEKQLPLSSSDESASIRINGRTYSLTELHIPHRTTLNQFIREEAAQFGTKNCCNEGGCGACAVVGTHLDAVTKKPVTYSLNSCQTLVYSCVGWDIETIEYIGNRYDGYHSLQKALVGFYGTQCGYCTPGFIMTMYGKAKSQEGKFTVDDVEKTLDGNICRCTGYRPILDAFKSLADDAPQELKNKLTDIEDAYKTCPKDGAKCSKRCSQDGHQEVDPCFTDVQSDLKWIANQTTWYRPTSMNALYEIVKKSQPKQTIQYVVGNTASGVYKNEDPADIYVDTSAISDFQTAALGEHVVMGANVSLQQAIELFRKASSLYFSQKHLATIADHWEKVANVNVRNRGSWAGNLMIKHKHREFPSDIFLTLVAADAVIVIGQPADASMTEMILEDFLQFDMKRNVIISIKLPPQPENTYLRTFKISPRAVNSHAYVNAAFKFDLDLKDGGLVRGKPTLVYGGINSEMVHTSKTEAFLENRRLSSEGTLKGALQLIGEEIKSAEDPLSSSTQYRKQLAQALFYKTVIGLFNSECSPDVRSGGESVHRPVSSGKQSFDANEDTWPVGQAIPKIESNIQAAGEAQYLDDVETLKDEVHGAFVQSSVANANIDSIDATEALKLPGVIGYIDAKDIPGTNTFFPYGVPDPIFAETKIEYAGQPVGLVVAKDRRTAKEAAKKVLVRYKDLIKPILTIDEALKDTEESNEDFEMENNVDGTLSGRFEQGSQFHFTLEPLSARVVPMEDGYDVTSTTQWPTLVQTAVAAALAIDNNSINLEVRRLGGGYGGKISRGTGVACAAAVASRVFKRPVRVVLDLEDNMTLIGWRDPYLTKYKVEFDNTGVLKNVWIRLFSDLGSNSNEPNVDFSKNSAPNVYYSPHWNITSKNVNTNTAANTYCRTPGTVECIASMENIIERIAFKLGKDPLEVREKNFLDKSKHTDQKIAPRGPNMVRTEIFPLLKKQSNYEARRKEIEIFNKNNRWKKRGISMLPLYYNLNYASFFKYGTQVSIFASDGTVILTHGGIEMGQGMNTKAVQVAAKILEVPLNLIKVKPTTLISAANSTVTGGSMGSDIVALGIQKCCEALRVRMDVIKKEEEEKTKKTLTWQELVRICLDKDVDLTERFWTASNQHPKSYDIFGAVCMEVEFDVLTGQYLIGRTDIIEDCGRSLSPYVDIGQIEGAFVMGLGFYTSECVKFDKVTGQKLTKGTWDYKVPTASDIPTDLRITLLPKGDNKDRGVMRSKATGEPALCMSYVFVTAMRQAIASARKDAGNAGWFEIDTPLTVDRVQQLCLINPTNFKLNTN